MKKTLTEKEKAMYREYYSLVNKINFNVDRDVFNLIPQLKPLFKRLLILDKKLHKIENKKNTL